MKIIPNFNPPVGHEDVENDCKKRKLLPHIIRHLSIHSNKNRALKNSELSDSRRIADENYAEHTLDVEKSQHGSGIYSILL